MGSQSNAKERRCTFLGVGSPYVYEVHESLTKEGWHVAAFIDNRNRGEGPSDLGQVSNLSEADPALVSLPVFMPLLTPGHRKAIVNQAQAAGFAHFPAHADRTAIVSASAKLGAGVLINTAATIGAKARVGDFVIVNRNASVGHDVIIEPYATLGPGCILCGSAKIGAGAFIGAGAIINPKVVVGANCVVGAGAVVVQDVEPNSIVTGNPARVTRTGIAGYNDVSV